MFFVSSEALPYAAPFVPIIPHISPEASIKAFTICAVVVLPFVPVIPTTLSFSQGLPKKFAEAIARACRVSSVII